MPYPPSFKRIAARTIDPATGASTWAFGSQRCTPYSGIFTRKAIRQPAHQILSPQLLRYKGSACWRISRDKVPVFCCNRRRATKRGREPASV